ncbi:MAG: PAS domain S-box protein [Candidatus Marinimicrobia bacterium]|nr:PAS domain S-box protein [Candidatus Neomarinimicrobiota bacterium]
MKKASIFIVEDNASEEKRIRHLLKRLNYNVTGSSPTGEGAIQQIREMTPDLILMDIFLEGELDGIETADRITSKYNIPILYLTAADETEHFSRARQTDPFGYILKPVSEKILQISIEMALDKVKQEKQLIAAKTYVENVLNSSLNMIIAVDNDRLITEFNVSAESSFGYNRIEVIGKHINLLYADEKQGIEVHNTTIKNGHSVREILNRHKNKSTFTSLLVSSVLKDEYGNKIGVMGISQDISELRKTQRKLYESQQYANNLIECSMDMIIAVDQNRRITEFNHAAVDTFGYTKEEILGNPIDVLYKAPKKGLDTHQEAYEKGKHISIVENKRKNGECFTSYLSASKIVDGDGNYIGIMGISRDITDKLNAEKKLKESEKKYRKLSEELSESNNLKELLLDIITHDLKNPIGVISGMSEILEDELSENEAVSVIKSSSDGLIQLINNIAVLSKVTIGESVEKAPSDLSQLIKEELEGFSAALERKAITVKLKLPEELIAEVNPIISEIFKNYISNAIKYASDGRKIVVEGQKLEDSVLINFKDFGKTIPVKERKRIFKRNIQLKRENRQGRGLGLAIVERIASIHNAEVGVKENAPTGNIFYLKIPYK